MFLEVLLALPLYIFIFYVFIKYKHIIKAMTSLDNLLSTLDVVNTPKEEVEQQRETIKDVIEHGKDKFLPGKKGKWSSDEIDKKTDEEVEKLYNIYMQRQVQAKGEMTARSMDSHIVKLYSHGVSKVLKIDDIEKLKQDIEEDPFIKDSMADIGILMVTTFGKWLSPILVACHTAKHTKGFVTTSSEQEEFQEENG